MPPSGLAVDDTQTTTADIVLTWTKTTGNMRYQKLQYRLKGNTAWTTLDDQINPDDETYTHSGLQAGTTYEYRLCAIGTDGRESVYTPLCTAYTKVSSMPSFTTDVQDIEVKDGESVTFSVVVQLGRGGQLDYQWEELLNNVWTAIPNTNRDYYRIDATKYDAGRKFRCIATETQGGIPAVITSATGELKIKKEDASVALTLSASSGNITYKTKLGDPITLTATVTSTSAAVGNKAGTVTFVIGLPGDTTSITLIGNGQASGNDYVAIATFTATYAGVHKITASYSGNTDYRSAESTEETYTANYPSGIKMLVLTGNDGKDYFDRVTVRAVYGESVLYKVSIAEIQSDGSLDKTPLQVSDLSFSDTYFSIADDTDDYIKFSCSAAGTSTSTLTCNDGVDNYSFDLNLEGLSRPVTVIADSKEVYLGDPLPALTCTAEDAADGDTPDGRGFLSADANEFSQFGNHLSCPTFDKDVRGTYPVEVTLPSGTFDNYNLQITPATVRVKGDEVTVDFGVAGSSNALLIGKVYNSAGEYEMQLTSGGKVEKGLKIKFTLEINEPGKHVTFWVVNNAIIPGTEGLLDYTLENYTDDVSVIANLDDSRYAVTYSATTADGSIQGYYSGTAPFASGTELFAGTDLKFVATPNSGYVVKEWTVNSVMVPGNTSNELLITRLGSVTAVAVVFEATATCAVTFGISEGSGTVTATTAAGAPLSSGASVDGGTTVTFTAQPAAGQIFRRWYVNGVAGVNTTTYTTTVTDDLNVEATFASASAQKYVVTYGAEPLSGVSIGSVSAISGTGSVYSGGSVEEGNHIVFTATVKPAYAATHKLSHWEVDGVVVPKGGTNTYTHYLNANVTVKAIFVEIAALISVVPAGANAPISGSVVITFSCEMDMSIAGTVELEDASSQTIPLTGGVWSDGNRTYTVAYNDLTLGTAYTIHLSGFEDADGNVMIANSANSFTTAATETYGVSTIALTGGTVNPDKAAYAENEPVTLTVSPATGYQLATISACKTGDPGTDVTLTEANGDYTFNMPGYGVTVTATFINPDQDAADAAKTIINGLPAASWTVSMATANTEADVKTWLTGRINALPGMSALDIDPVTTGDITTPGSFVSAIAGTSVIPSGINGAFTFTVTLKKGIATANTADQNGTITATAYVSAETPHISSQPQNRTVTQGGSTSLSVSANVSDGGTLSYQWYRSATNSNSGGTAIGGATGSNYSPPTSSTGTVYYYAVVTNTNYYVNGLPTAEARSNVAAVTVTSSTPTVNAETPYIYLHPQSRTVDAGVSITLSVAASVSDGGTLSYQWYRSASSNNSGGTAIGGATGSNYSPPTSSAGTTSYYVVVTNTNNRVNGSTTAWTTSNTATVTITATASSHTVAVVSTPYGTVTANKTSAAAGETVSLTIAPSPGYVLNSITAYRTDSPSTPVALSGTGSVRSFTMPAYSVTVVATFYKSPVQTDREAVDAAKASIEGGTYRIAQATGNDAQSIEAWLTDMLNALFGASHGVQLRAAVTPVIGNVTVTSVTPAVAGTEDSPSGADGWFIFSVTLTRGTATATAGILPGIIVATPHVTTPVKRIELHHAGTLRVRVANTGNVHTGEQAFALTGVHADMFTLLIDGQAVTWHNGLQPGKEHYVTLLPVSGLVPGIYGMQLTVSAEGMSPVSLDINYHYTPTSIDEISQAKVLQAYVTGDQLHVSGLIPGEFWTIYNMHGQLFHKTKATAPEAHVPLREHGVYIIVAGERVAKVVY
jgi:hypothetical protein